MAVTTSFPRAPVVTVVLGGATLVLAGVGLYQHEGPPPTSGSFEQLFSAWATLMFNSAVLLTLDTPANPPDNWWFSAARITAVLFFTAASFTVLQSLSSAFRAFVVRAAIRITSYLRPGRGHVVVIGLGRIGIQLVRDLRTTDRGVRGKIEPRRRVIVLVSQEDAYVAEARHLGALVLTGNPHSPEMRRRARVHLAHASFIVSEDDALNIDLAGEVLHDFLPQDAARRRRELRTPDGSDRARGLTRPSRLKTRLECYVHVGEPQIAEVFRSHDVFRLPQSVIDFHVFNTRDTAARQLLRDYPKGLARRYAPTDGEVAHYFLFGFGEMGQTVALHMARLAHFRNCRRLRLSIIDDFDGDVLAKKARDRFLDHHPGFCPDLSFSLVDPAFRNDTERDAWAYRGARPANPAWRSEDPAVVEYAVNAEFIDMPTNVDAPELMARLGARLTGDQRPHVKAAVVVCFDDDRRNFHAAHQLRDALARSLDESLAPLLPIYVYLAADRGLSLWVESSGGKEDRFPLHAFGQLERSAGHEEVVRPVLRELAMRFHDAYMAVEAERKGPPATEAERSQTGTTMSPAFRMSNEDAAAHADIKLDAIGYRKERRRPQDANTPSAAFSASQRELLAHMEHNRWMAERLVSGWRHGAPDDRRKRRPSFRPWEKLHDRSERAKDESQIRALVLAYEAAGCIVVPDADAASITTPNVAGASEPSTRTPVPAEGPLPERGTSASGATVR